MQTNIKSIFVGLFLASILFLPETILAQITSPGEQLEKTLSFWSLTLEQVRMQVGANQKEYGIFNRFYSHPIDSLHIDFLDKVNANKIDASNAKEYLTGEKTFIVNLFHNFQKVEQEYPTSVNEFMSAHPTRVNGDSCFTSCYNTDFADGTLDGWYGYYAENSSPDNNVGPFHITNITGGYCGPVVKAGGPDPFTGHDYQIRVTSGATNDPFLLAHGHTMPEVSPWASGGHSVMLGDSTRNGAGVAILSETFLVTPSTSNLTYEYSIILENPNPVHPYYAQPFFSVAVLDQNGDTIPTCGQYSVSAGIHTGFIGVYYPPEGDSAYWKNWTIVNVPLKHYIGQCITIIFQVQDCSLGGHFGYAYVDAGCSPAQIISSSPNFCGQDSIELTGPPGASEYRWTGPIGGVRGSDSGQNVWIDSVGVYRLVTIPVTGATCADTLYDTIRKINAARPHPAFMAPAVCVGQPTLFTNTSLPNDSGTFSWDFYDLGIYNYTSIPFKDTTWTYASPGIYTVKLHELWHGCGIDTLIKVTVDTAVGTPSFTAAPLCTGDSTFFTPTATHATSYDWHFGDPASGIHDSSKRVHPGHMFTSAGTYTVVLKAINSGNCDAIDSFPVTILATPAPVITGPDSVCIGGTVTLNVTGGTSYQWLPGGATGSSATFTPLATETITVNSSNGGCTASATFTLTTTPDPSASIIPTKDSVCPGSADTLTLQGHTGLKYLWKPGNGTTQSVHVTQSTTTTYTMYTFSGSCKDSTTITIPEITALTASARSDVDSICPGTSITLSVNTSGGGGQYTYSWSPGPGTSSSMTVIPDSTTTYTVTVNSFCSSTQKTVKVTMVPLPTPAINGTPWKCRGVRDTLTVSNGNGPATYIWSNGKTTTTIYTGLIDADSVITVTAFNKLGCPSTTTFPITLRLPDTLTIPPPPVFCAGQNVCISANATGSPGPSSYSWSSGETTSTICQKVDSATAFSVTVSNGCKSTRSTVVIPDYPNMNACCSQTISIVNDTVTPSVIYLSDSGNSVYYSWAPNVICLNPPLCSKVQPSPTPSVTTIYTVTGTDADSCKLQQYITITVDVPCFNLAIPNVFTPGNGGTLGLDKVFYIDTRNISAWSITIFDRWGKQMFTSTDPFKYWDGNTESGGTAPAGVYYYIITGTCQNTTYKKDGFLQLIR